MRYTQPPQELATAISKAASRNGVPYAVMVGIWRFESGSTFPNPAVNSSGYGGLFGTTNWNASTQAQADEAASVLAAGLKQSGGDIAGALSYYNTGKTDSVAGHDYAAKVLSLAGAGANVSAAAATPTPRPRPGGGGNPFGSVWNDAEKAAEAALGLGLSGGIAPAIGGVIASPLESAWNSVLGAISSPWDVIKAFLWLSDPRTWLRIFEALVGLALMAGSLALLARVLLAREATLAIPGLGRLVAAAPRAGVLRRTGSSSPARSSSSRARRPTDSELASARVRTEEERRRAVRARSRRALEEARDRRREREARERRAYFRGAADAGR